MKRLSVLFISIVISVFMLSACSLFGNNASEPVTDQDPASSSSGVGNEIDPNAEIIEQPEGNGIIFREEDDGKVVKKVKSAPEKYFGDWKATSDKSIYLYGNVDIRVNSDGTWSGNITDEKLTGTWENEGDHLHLTSELFNFDLAFDSKGTLFLIETGEDATFNTVLTRQ